MYERVIKLIGEEALNKIHQCKILLVGCGGVGSFVYEALIRSGFYNIVLIDKDKVDITNLNRQLIANLNTLNESKVKVAQEKARGLNENIKITALEMFLDENNINTLDKDFDFIIDACDTLNTKLALIKFALDNHIKIISAMGMGNRIDASKVKITTLDKTYNDPLAKKLRKLVKDERLNSKIKVVWSEEEPKQKGVVNSIIPVPGVAGLLIVSDIIKEIVNN